MIKQDFTDHDISLKTNNNGYIVMRLHLILPLLFILWIEALSAVVYSGQKEQTALTMRGQIKEIHLAEEDQSKVIFNLKLKMSITNEGNKPAILLKQNFFIGAEMLSGSLEEANAKRYIYLKTHWPSISRASEWTSWQERLKTAEPQHNLTWLLQPAESLEFETKTSLYIGKSKSSDVTNKSWNEIKEYSSLWLKAELRTWPVNIEPRRDPENLELGKSLGQKWESFGELCLERLISTPIRLDLSMASR
jgi:hypothetical protein